ncbi:MAG TPA: DUF3108 domain-containing protein [Bacteroidales bacterium]|nr:DUF3108 domain-containing protein [Bacteroidales bacterium]HPI69104.1 DUF3108 domain-containing protein [Bacteroidales bacterium]HPR12244.1 DUF3108 domain-containing protein [Bacteroidales bacterium]HRW83906.1 DUF3108 domain-containing protein [Bacteroidales bacterium]
MKRLFLTAVLFSIILLHAEGQFKAYQPGEKVEYLVHYGAINGGVATLELKRDSTTGKELWHSSMVAMTTGLADALFRVKDIYEVFMDPHTELPVVSIRNISEGRYRKYNVVTFDHHSRPDSAILSSDLTGIHITQHGIHDILTCFYWFRNHILPGIDTIKKGQMITIMTWFTDELYPIRMRYIDTEEIKIRTGKIKCHKFNPVTETGRLFKTEEDVSFWFSADNNFLPVKIRFNIFVGAFTVEMTAYEGLLHPLELKKK